MRIDEAIFTVTALPSRHPADRRLFTDLTCYLKRSLIGVGAGRVARGEGRGARMAHPDQRWPLQEHGYSVEVASTEADAVWSSPSGYDELDVSFSHGGNVAGVVGHRKGL